MRTLVGLSLVLALTACTGNGDVSSPPTTDSASPSTSTATKAQVPALEVSPVVKDLDIPWDVYPVDDNALLITERDDAEVLYHADGETRSLDFPSDSVWVSGETGLMSLEVHPDFDDNGIFYTCQGSEAGGEPDVRVMSWTLDPARTSATANGPVLTGLPATSGRHGGCRLLVADESLYVGTGDAATGENPQDLTSLGGKVLRLRLDGSPHPDNPYADAQNTNQRFVFTYGHRNVQGLSRADDGAIWSGEHGPDVDDEVNRLKSGGNYGWNPVPGYNESVPMTDQDLPGNQIEANWDTGEPTLAISGIDWVRGPEWGKLDGTLAVAGLRSEQLLFLSFAEDGTFQRARVPEQLREYGRLRSVRQHPDGSLLVTTANGENDLVLKVRPR